MRNQAITLFTLACFLPGSVNAAEKAIAPEWLIQAIIQIESQGNPYAVHVDGKAHYPATKNEALRLIAESVHTNFDVGLMQVNSWWMKKFNISPESLLDPAVNMTWGTRILEKEIASHGLNWQAVGKYHSQDVERGRRYAWKIYWNYAKERNNGKTGSQNISETGGIQRNPGISPQGRIVPLDLQQTGMSRNSGEKPGVSGSPAGAAKN